MDKKELNKEIEKTVLKMAMEPNNTDHYHELAKYYAMDNQYEKQSSQQEDFHDSFLDGNELIEEAIRFYIDHKLRQEGPDADHGA